MAQYEFKIEKNPDSASKLELHGVIREIASSPDVSMAPATATQGSDSVLFVYQASNHDKFTAFRDLMVTRLLTSVVVFLNNPDFIVRSGPKNYRYTLTNSPNNLSALSIYPIYDDAVSIRLTGNSEMISRISALMPKVIWDISNPTGRPLPRFRLIECQP
jgi:hypothetical protein